MMNFFYYCTHVTKDLHPSRRLQSSWVYLALIEIESSNSQARPNLLFSVPTKKGWGIQFSEVQDPTCDVMRHCHWSITWNSCSTSCSCAPTQSTMEHLHSCPSLHNQINRMPCSNILSSHWWIRFVTERGGESVTYANLKIFI